MKRWPDYTFERQAGGLVAGVDEAGRGPLAGPVVAAAVILDPAQIPAGLNDSKKLSGTRRAALWDAIQATAEVGLAWASVAEIETLNIRAASLLAMRRAVALLPRQPDLALIDGNAAPEGLTCRAQCVVKGDARCLSIAAASIIAKVARDRVMADLDRAFPGYGWAQNAGYPTASHRAALQYLGVTPHHRRTFAPVRNILLSGDFQPIDSNKEIDCESLLGDGAPIAVKSPSEAAAARGRHDTKNNRDGSC